VWPAIVVEAPALDDPLDADDLMAAVLDDHAPLAFEYLAERPLPPGGLWDPTFPPVPEPSPTPLRWRVFFADDDARRRAMDAIRAAMPSLRLAPEEIPDEDWAARSQRSLLAIAAGRFIVAPPWDLPPAAAGPDPPIVIVIEPSMGFGTGHHATTRLCLRLLSGLDVAGWRVADIGTGSGVLAMAAAMCGAVDVLGLDVDRDAIESARTSAALNTLPQGIRFEVGDFRATPPAPADLVLANLTGGMLRATAAALAGLLRPGGTLVLSGFDLSEVDAVRAAFGGLNEMARLEEDGWVALLLKGVVPSTARPSAVPWPAARSSRPPGGEAP
jgi:ribosomal protein L11 methyltransferase